MKFVMRATFQEIYPSEPDMEPRIEDGWTDPHNPYGGLKDYTTGLSGEAAQAAMEAADTIEFDTGWEAAEFILDFPGDVWDYNVGYSDASTDNHTGIATSVTLHVVDHEVFLFELADTIKGIRDRKKAKQTT